MTKERRLAIEMWQDIRKKLASGELLSNLKLREAKLAWLKAHKIKWYSECWFCHYFRQQGDRDYDYPDEEEGQVVSKSNQCPLNCNRPLTCDGYCIQYHTAQRISNPMERRLAAIDNIIKALKGEYKEAAYGIR